MNEFRETTSDTGGLRAPSHLKGWRKAWWWFDFVVLVNLARLRFIFILVVIGAIITQWDHLVSYYEKWTRPTTAEAAGSGVFEWFCPMHPSIIRDNPHDKCPICFMPLSKRKKGGESDAALPAGVVSRVQLTPYRIVLAGVQTTNVDYVPLAKEITAVGYVEFNESGQRTIAARFNGRIDKLYVSETGRKVAKGDVLASIYSPELAVATQSLVDAHKSGDRDRLQNTQTRMQRLGIGADQIDEIISKGEPTTELKIRSPINGHVIRKYVREGQYVQEGMSLFDIADLSTVWIQAQIYEDDLLFLPESLAHSDGSPLSESLPVTATTRALPGEEFHGMLTLVYPHVDQQTRTVTVRFELDNPQHKLRPGSTASVTLKVPPERTALMASTTNGEANRQEMLKQGKMLAVPESAVIDTGKQTIVYRQAEPSVFEGVLVKLGPRMAGPDGVSYFPVLDGLDAGTTVVTAGSFLVDAETRLNPAAGSIYFGGSGGAGKGGGSTIRPTTPDDPDAKITAALAKLSPEDRKLAVAQKFCPVLTQNRLGVMGSPLKLDIDGETVFLCCAGCKDQALENGAATVAKVKELRSQPAVTTETTKPTESSQGKRIEAALAKLSPEDRKLAEAQGHCPVLEKNRLGVMGVPVKIVIDGHPVFLCCASCREAALKNPQQTLKKAKALSGRAT